MVGKAEDVAILCLDICAMCPQAGSPSCRPHPPAGDEVGGDDFTLGENHVSAVQEGAGRVAPHRPPWLAPPLSGKIQPPVPRTSWLHSLLLAETLARWQIVPEAC